MGMNVSASISYGIRFDEGFEFPWDDEKYEGDYETWWEDVLGFKPTFSPWTDKGEYKEGIDHDDPRIDAYYEEKRKWEFDNPFPVEFNMCGSDECYDMVLSVPGIGIGGDWETPTEIDLSIFTVDQGGIDELIGFCKFYEIEYEEGPKWYLTCLQS